MGGLVWVGEEVGDCDIAIRWCYSIAEVLHPNISSGPFVSCSSTM